MKKKTFVQQPLNSLFESVKEKKLFPFFFFYYLLIMHVFECFIYAFASVTLVHISKDFSWTMSTVFNQLWTKEYLMPRKWLTGKSPFKSHLEIINDLALNLGTRPRTTCPSCRARPCPMRSANGWPRPSRSKRRPRGVRATRGRRSGRWLTPSAPGSLSSASTVVCPARSWCRCPPRCRRPWRPPTVGLSTRSASRKCVTGRRCGSWATSCSPGTAVFTSTRWVS